MLSNTYHCWDYRNRSLDYCKFWPYKKEFMLDIEYYRCALRSLTFKNMSNITFLERNYLLIGLKFLTFTTLCISPLEKIILEIYWLSNDHWFHSHIKYVVQWVFVNWWIIFLLTTYGYFWYLLLSSIYVTTTSLLGFSLKSSSWEYSSSR